MKPALSNVSVHVQSDRLSAARLHLELRTRAESVAYANLRTLSRSWLFVPHENGIAGECPRNLPNHP